MRRHALIYLKCLNYLILTYCIGALYNCCVYFTSPAKHDKFETKFWEDVNCQYGHRGDRYL